MSDGSQAAGEGAFDPLASPYPGLRAFDRDEVHLFFGRESQVDELLKRLQDSRFLAVLGPSGGGKSSLVRAGLLPALEGGFMTRAGSSWRIATFRPEDDPIGNLALALSAPSVLGSGADGEMADMERLLIETTLRGGMTGIVDVVREARLSPDENVLVVVDQFEELFRYARGGDDDLSDDPTLFVQLLIRAARSSGSAIYVVLTMRSDFLGDCTRIPGLAETINDGVYLIPQFTREERQRAIEGPVGVRGKRMSRGLVLRLLNDLGDRQDRLPVLQHAMMRTWQEWRRSGRTEDPLDLDHYEAIGGMEGALSGHADGVYRALEGDRRKDVARAMFKRLTYRENEGRGVRRPASVGEIARVVDATPEEVIEVARPFRERSQSFLLPPLLQADGNERIIGPDTVLDISHESLMRVWRELDGWVDEETGNRQRYVELAEAAALHQREEKGLLTEPELDIFLSWWDKHKPSEAWASQYDPSFHRAETYLRQSAEERDREERRAEDRRKRTLRLLWIWSVVSFFALMGYVALSVVTVMARNTAQDARERVDSLTAAALSLTAAADSAGEAATAAQVRADSLSERADSAQAQASLALDQAASARLAAAVDAARADSARALADAATLAAAAARDTADAALADARVAEARAETATREIAGLNRSAAARRLALESSRQPPRLQRLMALQAFNFQAEVADSASLQDRDIHRALAAALDDSVRILPAAHTDQVRTAVFGGGGAWVASADNAGTLCRTLLPESGSPASRCWDPLGQPIRTLAVAPGPSGWIVGGSQDGRVWIWDPEQPQARPTALTGVRCGPDAAACSTPVRAVAASGQGPDALTVVVVWADGSMRRWRRVGEGPFALQAQAGASPPPEALPVTAAAFSPDGRHVLVGREDGTFEIRRTDGSDPTVSESSGRGARISAAVLDNGGERYAVGLADGSILCWGCRAGQARPVVKPGHSAPVTGLAFAGTGDLLVSSSMDRSVRIWSPASAGAPWIPQTDHTGWVWSAAAAPGGLWFVSGGADQTVRIWRARTLDLAADVYARSCAEADSDLTSDEWELMGTGEAYQPTLATYARQWGIQSCSR